MSRKVILSLSAAVIIAAASLASDATYARGFGGGGFGVGRFGSGSHFFGHGGRTLTPILNPGRPGRPGRPGFPGFPGHPGGGWVYNHHHHGQRVFRGGRWIIIDDVVVDAGPAAGPCTCLTKTYTPNGLVVFSDICTKEAASAPVDGAADATQVPTSGATQVPTSGATQGPTSSAPQGPTSSATQGPTSSNYAGRTYADYLAANPQAAPQTPQKN